MLISCPSCDAGYEVPDHLLAGAGQTLRCARCQHEWVVRLPCADPAEDDLATVIHAPPPPPAPVHVPVHVEVHLPDPPPVFYPDMEQAQDPLDRILPLPTPPPMPAYNGKAIALAWALTVLMVVLFGFGAVYWRGAIMDAWPPSKRAYALIGLSA